jgi:hypothetical protein
MKKGFYFLLAMFAGYVVMSCSDTQSYSDMLKAEKKAISRLITDSSFVILKHFPDDTICGEKEFVKIDDGIYLSVLSRGDLDDRPVYGSSIILCRYDSYLLTGDTLAPYLNTIGPNSNGTHPVEFRYGDYTQGIKDYDYYNDMISPGLAAGLPYVGNNGIVKIIVPFKQMGTIGSFQSSGIPVYFAKVKYVIQK